MPPTQLLPTADAAETNNALRQLGGDAHYEALLTWLQGKSIHTRRSYQKAVHDFLLFINAHPRDARPLDVAGWKEHLKREGLTDSSVAQRLSAVSSYYQYLQKPLFDGRALLNHNPVHGVERHDLDVSPYEKSRKVSAADFGQILAQIPRDTPHGARDHALLLFYVLCGRRLSEVVGLYGRDVRVEGGRVQYKVRLKGGKSRWKEMPPPVWQAILYYFRATKRTLQADEPLFQATVDNGDYLRDFYQVARPDEPRPLTGAAVGQALKKYATRAGLDPQSLSVHSLRHLAAELFNQISGDVVETQQFLDHSHLNTTQIYLTQLAGSNHKHWEEMMRRLMEEGNGGLGD